MKKSMTDHIKTNSLIVILFGALIFGVIRITKTPMIRISDLESISFDYVTIDQNCASQRIRRAEGTAEERILSKEEVEELFGGSLQEFLKEYSLEAMQEETTEGQIYEITLKFDKKPEGQGEEQGEVNVAVASKEALDESFLSGKRYCYKDIDFFVYSYQEDGNPTKFLRVSFRCGNCSYMILGMSAEEGYVRKIMEYLIEHPIDTEEVRFAL